ncbi:hypothetical protein CJ205_06385 [Dolosicoccus paucivorans]|uniref:LysM domain-containing protein n=1 Tax=Dolosicoccus paucivorans TaxID=84521 RepID=A0A2N6SLY8_9LACT|nr:CAP domain-containing protein [Dolosicoccus paucivorans]PMC58066.1 hypothetical protein CJ205_06385 [Dolosicoccus paucivorans]
MNQGNKIMKKIRGVGWIAAATLATLSVGATTSDQVSHAQEEWMPNTVEDVRQRLEQEFEQEGYYTVVWGDTLSVIAEAANMTVHDIADANNIHDVDLIYAGDILILDIDRVTELVQNDQYIDFKENKVEGHSIKEGAVQEYEPGQKRPSEINKELFDKWQQEIDQNREEQGKDSIKPIGRPNKPSDKDDVQSKPEAPQEEQPETKPETKPEEKPNTNRPTNGLGHPVAQGWVKGETYPGYGKVSHVKTNFDGDFAEITKESAEVKYNKSKDDKYINYVYVEKKDGNLQKSIPQVKAEFIREFNKDNSVYINHALLQEEMLKLVNNLRESNGVTPLQSSQYLMKTARVRSQELADYGSLRIYKDVSDYGKPIGQMKSGYVAHTRPDFSSINDLLDLEYMATLGGRYSELGENSAENAYNGNPYELVSEKHLAELFFNQWYGSERHREHMLTPEYRSFGFGIAMGTSQKPDGSIEANNKIQGTQNFNTMSAELIDTTPGELTPIPSDQTNTKALSPEEYYEPISEVTEDDSKSPIPSYDDLDAFDWIEEFDWDAVE